MTSGDRPRRSEQILRRWLFEGAHKTFAGKLPGRRTTSKRGGRRIRRACRAGRSAMIMVATIGHTVCVGIRQCILYS